MTPRSWKGNKDTESESTNALLFDQKDPHMIIMTSHIIPRLALVLKAELKYTFKKKLFRSKASNTFSTAIGYQDSYHQCLMETRLKC